MIRDVVENNACF